MYDIFNNNKVFKFLSYTAEGVGTNNYPSTNGQDMWEKGDKGLYERNNRCLLIIDVVSVNSSGTLDITVEDYGTDDLTWDTDFCILSQITAAGLYIADIKWFRQYLRLSAKATVDTIDWAAYGIGFDATRRPVVQDGTIIHPTYASDRLITNADLYAFHD